MHRAQDYGPVEEMSDLLRQINRKMQRYFFEHVREAGLTPPHVWTLRALCREPGLGVSELARRIGTAKSHVSGIVDRMVKDGYLVKERDPQDRRLIRLSPTARARDFWEALRRTHRSALEAPLGRLSPDELEQMLMSLRRLASIFEEG